MTINNEEKSLNNKKAVEYVRKSTTPDDRQARSLADQHTDNEKTIKRFGIKVVKSFSESMSAKKRGRPFFNEMVEGIEKGSYEVIVCWALNRLSRNAVDAAILIELMDQRKLYAIATTSKVYYATPEDKLMLAIELGLSKKFSDDLGPTVLRGMYSKFNSGWIPGMEKPGYKNVKDSGEVIQTIDEERFPILRKAIELTLSGVYSAHQVLDKLNNEFGYRTKKTKHGGGQKMAKSSWYRFLRDPHNYGLMKWGGKEVTMHPSLPRLMTENEYWRIQKILGNTGAPRPKKHFGLPYKTILRCGECDYSVFPYIKPKKLANGETKNYEYMRCVKKNPNHKCEQPQVSIKELDKQILQILNDITISDSFLTWAIKWLRRDHEIETTNQNIILSNLNASLSQNQKKVNNLINMSLDGSVTPEEYKTKRVELEAERKSIEEDLGNLKQRTFDWVDLAEQTFRFAKNAKYHFENGSPEEKTIILKALGANFYLFNQKLVVELHKPFIILQTNHEAVNMAYDGVELELEDDLVAVSTSSNPSGDLSSIWWTVAESNR